MENESNFDKVTFVKEIPQLLKSVTEVNAENTKIFIDCISKYMNQPHVLDPLLFRLIPPLMSKIKNLPEDSLLACQMIYNLTKVRGYKTVEKFFPHEVVDVESTFKELEKQNRQDFQTWEIRYALLLWLSVLVLIPFNLSTLDSSLEGEKSLIERMIFLGKSYLQDSGKTRDAACIFLSRVLTRPDLISPHLDDFLKWSAEVIKKTREILSYEKIGIESTLAHIFARGKRSDLLPRIEIIYPILKDESLEDIKSSLDRKLHIKLTQRIALTYLKPKVASWRYHRGQRSLFDISSINKNKNNENKNEYENSNKEKKEENNEEEEEEEIPENMESIIEILLEGLKDKDTIVRWSSAKGIGRITGRLPKTSGDDIVEFILELFSIGETEDAWHGGCLALAELARRGLLLPSRLKTIIPLILKALQYDEKKGSHSVGSHVRDSACYVSWAFARAYSPKDLKDFSHILAKTLAVVSVFDREVNCRRAASAAFQENTGRQGSLIPHGIEIITEADYFTISTRLNSYLKVSIEIAKFPEYREALIQHLLEYKISHWGKSLRELVSKTLAKLANIDPQVFQDQYLPQLISNSLSEDLFERHGSILSVAEILLEFIETKFTISLQRFNEILNILEKLESQRLYRGKGGELIRFAACKLIEAVSLSNIPFINQKPESPNQGNDNNNFRNQKPKSTAKTFGQLLQMNLDENLKHPNEEIQNVANKALRIFTRNCYSNPPKKSAFDLVLRYIEYVLKEENASARRGYTCALGNFPNSFYSTPFQKDKNEEILLDKVIDALIFSTIIEEDPEKRDPETRRNAIIAFSSLCFETQNEFFKNEERIEKVFQVLLKGTQDYSTENRGDVGSWIRQASLSSLEDFIFLLIQQKKCTETRCHKFLLILIESCFEKIDKLRTCAGQIFERIVKKERFSLPYFPEEENLKKIFSKEIEWSKPNDCFPILLSDLYQLDFYKQKALCGIISSVGGIASSITIDYPHSFLDFVKLNCRTKEEIEKLGCELLKIFETYQGNDRIILPLLKIISQFFRQNVFNSTLLPMDFGSKLLSFLKKEITGCKEILKLLTSVSLFCWLITFPNPTRKQTFIRILLLLGNPFPRVRKLVANEFYTRLLIDEEIISDCKNPENIMTFLSTTKWDQNIIEIRKKRNELSSLLGIELNFK